MIRISKYPHMRGADSTAPLYYCIYSKERKNMPGYLFLGVVLGLSAGFAPGPVLTLVISETVQYGTRSGIKVAAAPLVTELPIILLTMLLLSRLQSSGAVLGLISIAGGAVIGYMGVSNIRYKYNGISETSRKSKSLLKGILANSLNPHPYIFWMSAGASYIRNALDSGWPCLVFFLTGFYTCLVGSKMFVAVAAGRSKTFLRGNVYTWIMRLLGAALCVLGAVLLYRGAAVITGYF